MEDQHALPSLLLTVTPESTVLFTTVLQSGIEIKNHAGLSVGHFLSELPGFTADYIGDTVQTIFLNGTAIDDLTTKLSGDNPVLALSSSMPGLAGAIFRRNSFHAALRTETQGATTTDSRQESLTVTLKLFNTIAQERGVELLELGACIQAAILASFLNKRPVLLQHIKDVVFDGVTIDKDRLLHTLSEFPKLKLRLVKAHG